MDRVPDKSNIERVAEQRGCAGPYPCGRGAGANGADLPCNCEFFAENRPLSDAATKVRTVVLTVCALCEAGKGEECHTPGCDFWMSTVPDLPPALSDGVAVDMLLSEIEDVKSPDSSGWDHTYNKALNDLAKRVAALTGERQ